MLQFYKKRTLTGLCLLALVWGVPVICWGQTTFTWDGEALTNRWQDANNWNPNGIPNSADNVILDNSSVAGIYTINLPDNSPVSINRLTIKPTTGNTITLLLATTNILANALSVGDNSVNTDDIVIESGGVLQNSSGCTVSAATPIALNSVSIGIFRINNGGKYIHNTLRAHANLVSQLSTIVGTETGIFEFNNPDAAVLFSLSDKIYGTLILNTSAATCTFTATGTKDVKVRGDLEIKPNVILNTAGFSAGKSFFIGRNLVNSGSWSTSINQKIAFNGTGDAQIISGNALIFANDVIIDNANGVNLNTSVTTGNLSFTAGNILLNTNNLTVNGSISGADATKYIVTDSDKSATSGFLIHNVSTTAVSFPVGSSISSYTPVTVSNSTLATNFQVRVFDDVFVNGTTGALVSQINDVVRKTWEITPVAATNATIGLQWNADEEGNNFPTATSSHTNAALFNNRAPSNSWSNINTVTITGGGSYSLAVTNISNFSRFTIGGPFVPLPLTLRTFTGQRRERVARLEWTTSSEKSNAGFEVERSADASEFETIGFVQALSSPQAVNHYTFRDDGLGRGQYYRLRQLDIDGLYTFSKILFVEGSAIVSFWPNPCIDRIHLSLPSKNSAELKLVSFSGLLLRQTKGSPDQLEAQLNEWLAILPPGIYLLQIQQDGRLLPLRMMKQ